MFSAVANINYAFPSCTTESVNALKAFKSKGFNSKIYEKYYEAFL